MFSNEAKSLITNSLYLYSVQGLNYILPLIVLPYLIKTLSIESFGIYTFALAFTQFVLLFVDFGFNITATKKIAENQDKEEFVKTTFWNIIFVKIFFSLFCFLVVLISLFIITKIKIYSEAILYSFIMVFGTSIFPLWWFQGLNRMKEISFINALSKIVTYPLIFIFVKGANDVNQAIIIQSTSFLIAGILSFFIINKTNNNYFRNVKLNNIREIYKSEIKDAFPIFLSNSSISLYTNSLTILLGFFSTNFNVGLFGAMERIVRVVCFGVLGPINQACFPMIANLKQTNLPRAKALYRKIILVVLILLCIAFFLFVLLRGYILSYFFADYKNINFLLTVFMLMIFPIAIGGLLGQLGLLGIGGTEEKKIFSRIYITVGLLSLPFSLILINKFELHGAVYSMVFVESVIFILFLFINKKNKIL